MNSLKRVASSDYYSRTLLHVETRVYNIVEFFAMKFPVAAIDFVGE